MNFSFLKLKKMSMRGKIILALSFVAIMVISLGAVNVYSNRKSIANLAEVYENEVVPAAAISEIDANLKEIRFRLAGVLLDQLPTEGTLNHLREIKVDVPIQWMKYKKLTQSKEFNSETKELILNLDQEFAKALPLFIERLEHFYSIDDKKSLSSILEDEWPIIHMKLVKPLTKLVLIQRNSIQETYQKAFVRGQKMITLALAILLASLAIVMIVFFSFNRLTHELNLFVKKISTTGDEVLDTSASLSFVSSEVSVGSDHATESLQSIMTAVEELSGMLKITTEHLGEAALLSSASRSAAERGEGQMKSLNKSMNEITMSSAKIEKIITVIEDIAFMTNLLALNAAVEAARAGEHGKGFAVVADEVRSLAQKSKMAAKDVSLLIAESVFNVESGVNIVKANEISLNEIIKSVNKLVDLNNEISSASIEQSKGINDISQSMGTLGQTVIKNTESAKKVLDASRGMERQSNELQDLVMNLSASIDGEKAA